MKYLFFFLLTCPIWAQQYTTEYLKMTGWQQLHLKGKVKSLKITSYEAETTDNKQLKALRLAEEEPIVQYLFDSEGKLTQREVYTAENTLSYTSHYSYNDAGRLALIRTPNIFGATDTTREETFEYGTNSQLLCYKDTYNGQVLEKRNYEYPAKGQQLTVYYSGGDFPFDRITYTYSAHRLAKEQQCEGSNCYRHDTYTYSANGNMIGKEIKNESVDYNYWCRYTYQYNSQGDCTSERVADALGEGSYIRYTYTYDSQKNIREKQIHNTNAPKIIKYDIVYYN